MNTPKVRPEDYVQFLLASPKQVTCTEAARVQPSQDQPPAHDSFNRLLTHQPASTDELWAEAHTQIRLDDGLLILDDSTLDKPHARHMGLVCWHWSGKHHRAVRGINLLTLLWTDGDRHVPCDYRLYDKAHDGLSKNDLFAQMLRTAQERGLSPKCVCFDSWYSSLGNLKLIRQLNWTWLCRLKSNRKVRVGCGRPQPVSAVAADEHGREVYLPGYGLIRLFRVVAPDGDTEYWASNDLGMSGLTRRQYAEFSWRVEEYHRGIKQFCGAERCQARRAEAQRNHIGYSIRAFLRLEVHCWNRGVSWFEAKWGIIRDAVRAYLANPSMLLPQVA